MWMIIFKLISQNCLRTQFTCLYNNVKFNNEFNLLLLSGLLDYPRMQNTILASKCLQYKINNWQRVTGCRVIIGCRRRLKQSSSTADSLVISFGLNENHGLNPSKEIRKMWAHYWRPLTGLRVCVCLFFPSSIRNKSFDSPPLNEVNIPFSQSRLYLYSRAVPLIFISTQLFVEKRKKLLCTCNGAELIKILYNTLYGLQQII